MFKLFTRLQWHLKGNIEESKVVVDKSLQDMGESIKQDSTDVKNDIETSQNNIEIEQDKTQPYIEGPQAVKSFDRATYKIFNISGGEWYLKYNNKEEFSLNSSKDTITIDITIGEIGNFILIYRTKERDITLSVKVEAFQHFKRR